jgi:hypothetical protein
MRVDPLALRLAARYEAAILRNPTKPNCEWTNEERDPTTGHLAREMYWRADEIVEVDDDYNDRDGQT